jgi:PTS hybrid protein
VIGLVLVSHSPKLVDGLRDLVEQMEPEVPLAIAGGTDDGELGTSLELVTEAIETADGGDGVVILYDLGSAEMTADSAVEFLDDEARTRCLVVDAPLVEGAIAAAVAAGGDANLGAVAAAAAGAASRDGSDDDGDGDDNDEGIELRLTNVGGLHARPAGKIARAVRNLDADVRIEHAGTGEKANAASTLRLVSLGVPAGESIIVRAGGPEADQALTTVRDLVNDRFGEEAADL